MNWTAHFIIAAAILVLAVLAVIICEKKKIKRGKLLSSFNILVYGVALCAFVIFWPYYYNFGTMKLRGVLSAFTSFYSVLRMFALDGEYTFFIETVAAGGEIFNTVYLAFTIIVTVIAPFFTFGVVLSFFKDIRAYCAHFVRRNHKRYIFSELNERSAALAKDICNNDTNAVIIFTDVDSVNDQENDLEKEVSDIGAICFKKDVLSVNLNIRKQTKETSFFLMGSDGDAVLEQTLKLLDIYKNRENTNIYLFSDSVESELMLTSADKGKVKVRRINEIQSLINRNLYDEGHLLFDSAVLKEDGKKHISALIAGVGRYGTAMLKALTWYCQMDGYIIDITAVDKNFDAKNVFEAQCPALMAEEYRNISVEDEAQYSITVYSGVDVASKAFMDIVDAMNDVTFVFTALGTDEENVKAAVNIRMLCERKGVKPVIQAVLHSSVKKDVLKDINNHRGEKYDISFIGDIDTSYTQKVILNSELEKAGLECHKRYNDNEDDFWKYEYNYRSSVASAIHIKAREYCGVSSAEDIGNIEHRRWNAYMRSEGFVYSGSTDETSRNFLGKMHHNLVPVSLLDDKAKNKDIRIGTK